jgi:hypothetical protein
MTASTRILLGGFYIAALTWPATQLSHRHFDPFLVGHGPIVVWRFSALTVLLLASLLTCLAALVVTTSRGLTLAAASINFFYSLCGIALFVWLFVFARVHRFEYHFESGDVFAAYFLVLVPGVAAAAFSKAFRVLGA